MPMNIETENSGIAFYNDDKQNANGPDMSGQVNVGGRQYRIAMWNNKKDDGSENIGIKFTEVEDAAEAAPARREAAAPRQQYAKPSRRRP